MEKEKTGWESMKEAARSFVHKFVYDEADPIGGKRNRLEGSASPHHQSDDFLRNVDQASWNNGSRAANAKNARRLESDEKGTSFSRGARTSTDDKENPNSGRDVL